MRIFSLIICLALTMNSLAQQAAIVRGPYLQKGYLDKVTVCFRTDSVLSTTIRFGTELSKLDQVTGSSNAMNNHQIQVQGLSPNTKYYYELMVGDKVLLPKSKELYFRTHHDVSTKETINGWVLGDCGKASDEQREVRDAYYRHAAQQPTDLILFLGDNAYNDGKDEEYQTAIFENMYEDILKNTISWSCLGNHDGHSAKSASQSGPYYDIFDFPKNAECGGLASGTEAYYSFNYGNTHFISLDSYDSDRSETGQMHQWLENDLANNSSKWTVAFWHHPAYSKGSHNSDTEDRCIEMREHFLPLLESYGVDVIFSGHSHSYERSYMIQAHYDSSKTFDIQRNTVGNGSGNGREDGDGAYRKTTSGELAGKGMVYLTAGSSGHITDQGTLDHKAMCITLLKLGSCAFEITDERFDLKFIDEKGNVEDYFTIVK